MNYRVETGILEFEDFELDARARTLRRSGAPVAITSRVFDVLVLLASNHGRVVEKDELLKEIWPDTVVEEGNLHQCVSTLRRVLGEKPDERRFIATLPGRGYSFIATVRVRTLEAPQPKQSRRPLWLWMSLAAAAGLLIAGAWVLAGRIQQNHIVRAIPLMASPGLAESPTFSPNSREIALSWRAEGDTNSHIYVKSIDSGSLRPLTSGSYSDTAPTWSADGKLIAFFRRPPTGDELWHCVVSASGGEVRVLHARKGVMGGIQDSWTADSKQLIFTERASPDAPPRLNSVSVESGQIRPITAPTGDQSDLAPAVSPDGNWIAFLRAVGRGWTIQVIPSKGGDPKQILGPDQNVDRAGLTWEPDGRHVVYRSNLGGLWEASLRGGRPNRLHVGSESANFPAVSTRGDLAFTESYQEMALERISTTGNSAPPIKHVVLESTRTILDPQWSPDGTRIAFYSDRSGTTEIWKSDSNGANLKQLTAFGTTLTRNPRWSPDGKRIAFDSISGGKGHLHVIAADGGPDRQVTNDEFTEIIPAWSNDGSKHFFASPRSETWQIWSVPASGGVPAQVTFLGGFFPAISTDDYLYYVRAPGDRTLLRTRAGGGAEEVVLDSALGNTAWWTLAPGGVFYIDRYYALRYFDLASRRSTDVLEQFKRDGLPLLSTIAASPDGRAVLCPVITRSMSDVMLVKHFW